MDQYLPSDVIINLILFQFVILVVVLSNVHLLHRPRKHSPPDDFPMVSILVPARNEEKNIGRCIYSLLAQDYPSCEILVLDDQSSDNTLAILKQIAIAKPELKVLSGSPTPEGQSGKNWACSQLAQYAQGDLLLFTDADTIHHPETLRTLVSSSIGERSDLLTGFPRQHVVSWGERLLVPFFSWASLCFIPIWLAYRFRLQALTVAVGQMMLFRREAYQIVGGHEALGTAIVDDIMFARKVRSAGLRWRMVRISDLITCRMYHGSREAVDGFTKNLFAAFDFRLLIFLFAFIWLAILFWVPLFFLTAFALGQAPLTQIEDLVFCLCLSLLLWLIPYLELGIPLYLALLYPITILANEVIAIRSLFFSLTGKLKWKDRSLVRPKWRWL